MLRYIFTFFILFSSLGSVHASQDISNGFPKNNPISDISMHSGIEKTLGIGKGYLDFSTAYVFSWRAFFQKYSPSVRSYALVPTRDRTTEYRLRIQEYPLSCEISALQVILYRLGIQVTEDDILLSIPQHPFIYNTGGIWGDPDKEFVGHFRGKQSRRTGYGIYAPPLAQYAQMFSLRTEIIDSSGHSDTLTRETHLEYLLKNLEDINTHTLLWGDYCTDPLFEDGIFPRGGTALISFFGLSGRNMCNSFSYNRNISWLTREGKRVYGLSGEHAFILLGYIGTPVDPTHIIVWDTYSGRHIYPYAEWMRKWSAMQYRSLTIFRER